MSLLGDYRPECDIPRILIYVRVAATTDVPHPTIVLQLSATLGPIAQTKTATGVALVEKRRKKISLLAPHTKYINVVSSLH